MTKSLLIPPLNCRSLSNYTQANNSAPSSFRRKTKSTIKQMAMRSPSMKWAVWLFLLFIFIMEVMQK